MSAPKLAVIIVNYCTADMVLSGLQGTLDQLDEIPGGAVCWIVDNASPDGSADVLERGLARPEFAGRAELIRAERNGGFGYGNNLAIRRAIEAGIPYVYMVNPDAVPQNGAIQSLLEHMEAHPDVGAVGSHLVDESGAWQPGFFRFPGLGSELDTACRVGVISRLLRRYHISYARFEQPQDVDWITGASFMARVETLQEVGLFDEDFFLYWEETELCHRIRAAGWRIMGVPGAVVTHIAGVATGVQGSQKRRPKYWYESRNMYFDKTGYRLRTTLLNMAVVVGLMIRRVYETLIRRPWAVPYYLRDFIRYCLLRRT